MPRTDVHRPSAINPADYRFVAFDYLRQVEAGDTPVDLSGCTWLQAERETLRQDMTRTDGTWSDHAHGGNCMCCGNANAMYTAAFYHAPTNSYVRLGSTCSRNVEVSLDHDAFMRFRNRVSSWLQRENRVPLAVAALSQRGLGQLGQFCGASEVLSDDYTQRTISDICYRLLQNGTLSARQWDYLVVLRDRWLNPTAAVRQNQYPGQCTRCQQQVEAFAGTIARDGPHGRWTVHHLDGQCPPRPSIDFAPEATLYVTPEPAPEPPPPAQPVDPHFVGTTTNVGELTGVMALFERARMHLQAPAVVMDVPNAPTVRVSIAGERSRYNGQVIVVGETQIAGRRPFLGVINAQGDLQASGRVRLLGIAAPLVARLRQFAENPAQVAGEYGRLHGRCCFCRLPLTDARSTAVGYGAVCAGHYGLPWGERPAEFAAPVASTGGVVERQQTVIRQAMQSLPRAADWFQLAERPAPPRTPREGPPSPGAREAYARAAQLDLNFDAAAEHARRVNSGTECPACESTSIIDVRTNSWRCHTCSVTWNKQE